MVANGGWLWFAATRPTTGYELWRSKGTAATTSLVEDIFPGPSDGVIMSPISPVGTRVVLGADDGTHGDELWVSGGTAATTKLLKDINLVHP
jgi:ELWxxDGT repeat protein